MNEIDYFNVHRIKKLKPRSRVTIKKTTVSRPLVGLVVFLYA